MGYTIATIKGISWMGALRVGTRLLTVFRIAILARLLTPAQFGIVGIATLALGFVEILTETGINIFLVQEQKKIDSYVHTAWIISIVRGFLIGFLILICAPLVATFFRTPDALSLLLLTSVIPVMRGFINPAIVQFQNELRFDKEFWFRFLIFSIDSVFAIVLALITQDATSIIWGFIIGALIEVVLSFLLVRPTPRFTFEKEKLINVLQRGKWITLAGIFDYAFRHGDDIVVGRLLNTSFLGLYQNAYKLSELPLTEVAVVVSKVTFPVFSKISKDLTRLRRAFYKTMIAISTLVIPIGVILFTFPREVILLILGPQWTEASFALQILALFGVFRAIAGSANVLFLSVKKQEYITITTLVATIVLLITIVPLVTTYGIVGAGLAATAGLLFSLPLTVYFSWRILS